MAPDHSQKISSIRIANAPCSWGVLEFSLEGEASGAECVLAEMRKAGYEGTEFGDWGFLPTNADDLGSLLKCHNLQLVGAFIPIAFANPACLPEGTRSALRTARLLAAVEPNAFIVLSDDNGTVPERTSCAGRIQPGQGLTAAAWKPYGQRVDLVARQVLEETGLRSVFHHHCAGYVETVDEINSLLEATTEDLVGLCLDTGHLAFGGGDPLATLKRYRSRIWHVHFKDCSVQVAARSQSESWDYFQSVGEGVFCELGCGNVDFPAILAELHHTDYTGWIVVEQDVLPGMGTPLESACRNRNYLHTLGV